MVSDPLICVLANFSATRSAAQACSLESYFGNTVMSYFGFGTYIRGGGSFAAAAQPPRNVTDNSRLFIFSSLNPV